jgi:hypothetical protein
VPRLVTQDFHGAGKHYRRRDAKTRSCGSSRNSIPFARNSRTVAANSSHTSLSSCFAPSEGWTPSSDGGSDLCTVNDPSLLILTSLSSGPEHGHALLVDIDAFAAVRLGPGTLDGAVTRLEERGLIEPLDTDDRRRAYRLTAAWTTALSDSLAGLRRIVEAGSTRLAAAT